MRRIYVPFVCVFLLLGSALPLRGQVRVDGIVRDDATGQPLPGVRVELLHSWGSVARTRVTDSLGAFSVPIRRLGTYRLRVRGPGYAPAVATLLTEAYVFHNVEIRIRQRLPLMAPLTLLARAQSMPSPVLEGFHARLRRARGRFITREEVESVRPGYVSDMIAPTPGMIVRRGGVDGQDRLLYARRVLASGVRRADCAVRIYIDGELINPLLAGGEVGPASLDATVEQTMVEGIEVYPEASVVPAEFGGGAGDCGAVAVWTRRSRMNTVSAAR